MLWLLWLGRLYCRQMGLKVTTLVDWWRLLRSVVIAIPLVQATQGIGQKEH